LRELDARLGIDELLDRLRADLHGRQPRRPHRASGGQQLSAPGAREDDQQCPAPQDEDPAGEVDGGRPWLLDHAGG
jgi:hypothetical protein